MVLQKADVVRFKHSVIFLRKREKPGNPALKITDRRASAHMKQYVNQ